MGPFDGNQDPEEMRRWIEVIEDFNRRQSGESPYEVIGVDRKPDGTTTLVLKKKA